MWLTHYTDCRNLDTIRKTRVLQCAFCLMNADERARYADKKREANRRVKRGAVLRDQQPLSNRIVFSDGADFSAYVKYLNRHVFFWAKAYRGENYRKNFRKKYPFPKHIGLRCKLSDLCNANPDAVILFSSVNSGTTPHAPKKSKRSLSLFKPITERNGKPIAEIVVRGKVHLPDSTEIKYENDGWEKFFTAQK